MSQSSSTCILSIRTPHRQSSTAQLDIATSTNLHPTRFHHLARPPPPLALFCFEFQFQYHPTQLHNPPIVSPDSLEIPHTRPHLPPLPRLSLSPRSDLPLLSASAPIAARARLSLSPIQLCSIHPLHSCFLSASLVPAPRGLTTSATGHFGFLEIATHPNSRSDPGQAIPRFGRGTRKAQGGHHRLIYAPETDPSDASDASTPPSDRQQRPKQAPDTDLPPRHKTGQISGNSQESTFRDTLTSLNRSPLYRFRRLFFVQPPPFAFLFLGRPHPFTPTHSPHHLPHAPLSPPPPVLSPHHVLGPHPRLHPRSRHRLSRSSRHRR